MSTKSTAINLQKMDSMAKRLLASSLIDDLQKHFNNPENQRRFQEWQKRRTMTDEKA